MFLAFTREAALQRRFEAVEDSITSLNPPFPDLSVDYRQGGTVGFELTRIQDQGTARRMALQLKSQDRLRGELGQLGVSDRDLWVSFNKEASIRSVLNISASIAKLAAAAIPTPGIDLRSPVPLTAELGGLVEQLLVYEGMGLVHVDSYGHYGDPVLDRVQSKFGKDYSGEFPLELLCYYYVQDSGTYEILDRYRCQVREFVQANLDSSPFRAVWIFDASSRVILDELR